MKKGYEQITYKRGNTTAFKTETNDQLITKEMQTKIIKKAFLFVCF